jgi:hypothetical protein
MDNSLLKVPLVGNLLLEGTCSGMTVHLLNAGGNTHFQYRTDDFFLQRIAHHQEDRKCGKS